VIRPAIGRSRTRTTSILDRQRPPPAATATSGPTDELDLELKPLAVIGHRREDHPTNTDKAANVIPHPLFLLVRVSTTRSLGGAPDVSYPSPNPAKSAIPQYSPGADL
jgi:hypothetical protein